MRAVIFDLDETLINSAVDFREMKHKIIEYLESRGVTSGLLSDQMLNFEITRVAMEQLRMKGLSEEQVRRVLGKVSEIMNEVELESLNRATLVEGVLEALKALKRNGLKLGIMTRSCREYAEKVLTRFGLRGYFDAVVARDDVEKPKPHPEHAFQLLRALSVPAEEVLFVGDHWLDAECARKSGIKFVLVRRPGQDMGRLIGSSFQTVGSIKDIVMLVEQSG